jgi:general secretion pathway protein L
VRRQLLIDLSETAARGEEGASPQASWVVRDAERPAGTYHHGALSEAAAQANGAQVIALVPGTDVLMAQVEMPNLNRQRMAKAAPYAMEEQLAGDVEDLHVAVGERNTDGQVTNAVVSREVMEAWLAKLKEAGLQADIVTSQLFGVPWSAGDADSGSQWTLVTGEGRALLRTGLQTGLALDQVNLVTVMRAMLDEADAHMPGKLEVVVCGEDDFSHSPTYQGLQALCEEFQVTLALRQSDDSCPLVLARGFTEKGSINFLQGAYSRKEQLEKLLRPWRPVLILLALWLVAQVVLVGMDYSHLSTEQKQLRQQVESIYREAFPQSRLVPGKEKALMERGLEKLRGGDGGTKGFLALLSQAGNILKDTDSLKLRSLRYKEGKLNVDFEIANLQAVDTLKQRLSDEAKLQVEIVSASSREGKVEGRIALQEAGS